MSKHPTKLKEINHTHVSSKTKRIVYRGFFSVEEHELSFQKFNKTQSNVVKRSALVSSDAVIVLPYDPINDRVLLIEQFRTGPYVKGDNNPWVLEPIAGIVDKSESPETAGLREAQEEAHLKIDKLKLVARSYPSPGISTEFFHQYIGIVSLPESTNLVSGLESESEDIRSHIFSYKEFSKMILEGEINVGPAILLGLWLSKNRKNLMEEFSR
jgi:nudix-type nucleoside diphosphatase (YffH/AdpP family)